MQNTYTFDRGTIHHKCYKQQQLSLGHIIIIFSPLLELLKSSSWFTANQPEILLLLTQKGHEIKFADTHKNWDAIAREKEPATERKFLCGNNRKRREGEKEEESWSSLFSLSLLSCTVSTRTGVSEGEPLQNLGNNQQTRTCVSEGEGWEGMYYVPWASSIFSSFCFGGIV